MIVAYTSHVSRMVCMYLAELSAHPAWQQNPPECVSPLMNSRLGMRGVWFNYNNQLHNLWSAVEGLRHKQHFLGPMLRTSPVLCHFGDRSFFVRGLPQSMA